MGWSKWEAWRRSSGLGCCGLFPVSAPMEGHTVRAAFEVLSALFNIHSFTRILTALSGDRCVMAGVPLTLQLPLSLLSSSSSSSLSLCLFFFNQFDKVNSLSTRSLGRIHQLLAAVFIQLESFAHTKSQTWQVDYRPVQTVWGCELWPAAYGQKKTQQWPRIHMDKCVAGAPCGFVMTSVECQNYIKVKMYRVQPLQKKVHCEREEGCYY